MTSAFNNHTDSLDTNLVIRVITSDIPAQRFRVIKFLDTSTATHYLSNIALSEIAYVLQSQYQYTRPEIIDGLFFFLARYDGKIKYDRKLTSLAFPLYLSHPKLSFNDCLLSAEAEYTHHEPLFTLDRKLARQAENAKLIP